MKYSLRSKIELFRVCDAGDAMLPEADTKLHCC